MLDYTNKYEGTVNCNAIIQIIVLRLNKYYFTLTFCSRSSLHFSSSCSYLRFRASISPLLNYYKCNTLLVILNVHVHTFLLTTLVFLDKNCSVGLLFRTNCLHVHLTVHFSIPVSIQLWCPLPHIVCLL